MVVNEETLDIYLKMYEILSRKRKDDKSLIFEAAQAMICAIDKQGNIPAKY